MSKANTSSRLLATLRFTIPSKSSRTLNATQAYDKTSSGITLASATGTLVDKGAAVKGGPSPIVSSADVGLTAYGSPTVHPTVHPTVYKDADPVPDGGQRQTPTYVIPAAYRTAELSITARGVNPLGRKIGSDQGWNFASFTGAASDKELLIGLSKNSKATNPNTTFYGGISVATGDYRKWQRKYAVLKLNTTTGKGVLRIYEGG